MELCTCTQNVSCVGQLDSLGGSKPIPRALPLSIVSDLVHLPPSSSGTTSVVQSEQQAVAWDGWNAVGIRFWRDSGILSSLQN